jgi:hypothetical protein
MLLPSLLRYLLLLSYLFLLSNPVSSGLSLKIVLRIPVTVKDDDCVCGGQVDAQTSSSGGQQEAEVLGSEWHQLDRNKGTLLDSVGPGKCWFH